MKKFLANNRVCVSAAITVLLLSSSSCAVRESSLMRLVPVESCAVMTIDWESLKADAQLKRALKGAEFDALLRNLRIDGESVSTVAIFSSIDSKNTGLLLRGSFDPKQIATGLKANGWREESLDGHKVYVHAGDYVAMPGSNVLFAGTREGTVGVFRAAEDSKESIVASDAYKKINSTLTKKGQPLRAFLLIRKAHSIWPMLL